MGWHRSGIIRLWNGRARATVEDMLAATLGGSLPSQVGFELYAGGSRGTFLRCEYMAHELV